MTQDFSIIMPPTMKEVIILLRGPILVGFNFVMGMKAPIQQAPKSMAAQALPANPTT